MTEEECWGNAAVVVMLFLVVLMGGALIVTTLHGEESTEEDNLPFSIEYSLSRQTIDDHVANATRHQMQQMAEFICKESCTAGYDGNGCVHLSAYTDKPADTCVQCLKQCNSRSPFYVPHEVDIIKCKAERTRKCQDSQAACGQTCKFHNRNTYGPCMQRYGCNRKYDACLKEVNDICV